MNISPLRIGIVFWGPGEGIASEAADSFSMLGHQVIRFHSCGKIPDDLDVVFAYGPFGSMVPLANALGEISESERPRFIFWQTEPLPNPALPRILVKEVGNLRSAIERLAFKRNLKGHWELRPGWQWLTNRGFRYRYCGDLLWLRNQGILTCLIISSRPNAEFLCSLGLDPYLPPTPNYRDGWGADLNLERDIPVLWLGKAATRRRRRLIQRIRKDLRNLGVEMLVIDGVENEYVFGDERTRLLNRTRIVLNLQRYPWDNHGMRFQLAAMNGALVISEPCLDHTGFTPGEHFVEAAPERIAETILYYLEHEGEREQMTARAHELVYQISRREIYGQILAREFGIDSESNG